MGSVHNAIETLLDEHDVARVTSSSVASVRRWRLLRQGPKYIKIDAAVRYRPEDISAWLESRPSGGRARSRRVHLLRIGLPALGARVRRNGAEALVNLSNDGYFGRSAARQQHLKLVRMRAIENRRWIVRSTNDGITAVIDPAGRVTQRLEPYQKAAARARFAWSRETTFYTRHGDWFAWSCLLLGLAACASRLAPRCSRDR